MFPKGIQQGWSLCWAGSLEWLFNHHGINLPQANFVAAVKGRLIDQGATPPEIVGALNGVTFSHGHAEYQIGCNYFDGSYAPWILKSELQNNNPPIIALDLGLTWHAVVLHKANFIPGVFVDGLQNAIIFDPAYGQDRTLDSWDYLRQTVATINVSINRLAF